MSKRLLLLFLFLSAYAAAQTPATGFPMYGSFEDGRFDVVNRNNMNVHFEIPIVANSGRGVPFVYVIHYNSLVWQRYGNTWGQVNNLSQWGWRRDDSVVLGRAQNQAQLKICNIDDNEAVRYYNFVYYDSSGTPHPFSMNFHDVATACKYSTSGRVGYATDGSGFYMDATEPDAPVVWDAGGNKLETIATKRVTDTNGNYVSLSGSNWTDTVGRTALQITTGTNYVDYTFQDADGNPQTTRVNLQTFNIKSNFGCSGVTDYTGTASLPVSIVLPNDKQYSITYEPTPGFSGYYRARVQRVTLPTGGYYEYTYQNPNGGINCTTGEILRMTKVVHDGTVSSTWIFNRTGNDTKVTEPLLPYDSVPNESVFTFTAGKETSRKIYQGAAAPETLLRTVNTTWGTNSPSSQTVIFDGGKQVKTETDFDTYGNLTESREYDFYNGTSWSLLRKTTTTFSSLLVRIKNRPTQVMVRDGAVPPNIVSLTDISYDGSSLTCPASAPQHNATGFPCTFLTRGNPTSITRYANAAVPSGGLTTTLTYDWFGNVLTASDPGGHTTSFSYTDNYVDTPNQSSFAYLTQITKPSPFQSQTIAFKYYYPSGQAASTTDENSRVTTSFYSDSMRRLTRTDFPDGGQTTLAYDDTNRTVTTTQKRTSVPEYITTTAVLNQLGQMKQQLLPGNRKVDFVYDPFGRLWRQTNPYISDTEDTYGVVETRLDALGRVKTAVQQDSQTVQYAYAGTATQVTDESGHIKQSDADALGRTIKLCEVTVGNTRDPAATCNTGFTGSGYVSTSSYDTLGNLTSHTQGSQTRTSSYDSLGRITAARILETSSSTDVTYGYNSEGLLKTVTDPRGTVEVNYDALHRITWKKHGTTTVASYEYDVAPSWMSDLTNVVGRLTVARNQYCGTAGSSASCATNSYDAMGRVIRQWQQTPTSSPGGHFLYFAYDLAGNMTSLTYPSGRVVQYTYSANGELDRLADITGTAFDYVKAGTTYSPLGSLSMLEFGNSVKTTLGANNRQQLTSILTQKVGGATYLNQSYAYFNDGHIQQITDALSGLKSEKFTYDELHRLLTAQRGPDNDIQRKYEYDYDRYGNRWGQNFAAGTPTDKGYGTTHSFSDLSNRVSTSGYVFDLSGNLSQNGPGSPTFAYDLENFTTAMGGMPTYVNDVDGRRIQMNGAAPTEYFYMGSEVIAEKTGSSWIDYIFFGGQRIAKQTGSSSSTATYFHGDHLGSIRVASNPSGASAGTCDYEPYGEIQPGSTCNLPTDFRFAGARYDTIANNDLYYFWFRQYDARQGRWMGVDALPGSEDDTQSMNRYIYALNSPPNFVDPLGLANDPLEGEKWFFYGGVCGKFSGKCLRSVGWFEAVMDRLTRSPIGVPIGSCFLSGNCPADIPRTPGFGDFIPDFTPQCEGPIAAFLPSCGQTIPNLPGVFDYQKRARVSPLGGAQSECKKGAEKQFLNDIAAARKENFRTAAKAVGKAYVFTSLVGCVAGSAAGGAGCLAGAAAADAAATPMILGGATFWFFASQGYDVLRAADRHMNNSLACRPKAR